MTKKRIIITGATGLIGGKLCTALVKRGDEVTVFTRSRNKAEETLTNADHYIEWNYKEAGEWQKHINGMDAVVHLAGANLFAKKWTGKFKKKIIESRQVSSKNIVDAISKAEKKPEVFICASGAGYYGDYGEDVITEEDLPGDDFLARVCRIWEEEASKAEKFGVRRVSIRTSVVLSKDGGALKQMLTPFKFFVGGPLGSGKQWFPWIHIDDLVGAYIFAIDNNNLSGPVNAAAPDPQRMTDFADTLGEVLHRPSLFRVPLFVLKIAVGEFGEAITYSQKIIPKKLLEEGFRFEYEELEEALKNLLNLEHQHADNTD